MKSIFDWLQHNKEWVFSGVGCSVIFGGIAVLMRWLSTPNAPLSRARSLQVNLAFGALTYEAPPYVGDNMLIFTIGNPSDRPVQLSGIRLALKNGANMVFPHLEGEKRLPCMIDPATSSKFWVALSDIQASIRNRGDIGHVEVHALASDGLGNDYPSNPVTLR